MATIRDYIDGAFKNDAVEEIGINGFVTVARVRERVTKTSDAPVTFLEDGSHVNDHIILNPITISIEGNVSDIHLRPSPAIEILRAAQARVGNITQYIPARTQTQLSKVSGLAADLTNAVAIADSIIDAGGAISGYAGSGRNVQQGNINKFIDMLESVRESRALIQIEMPYKTYDKMCITSIEIIKDNQQNAISFNLEAQQFRFASTSFVAAPKASAATGGQTESTKDKGVQEGKKVPQSFVDSILERFGY